MATTNVFAATALGWEAAVEDFQEGYAALSDATDAQYEALSPFEFFAGKFLENGQAAQEWRAYAHRGTDMWVAVVDVISEP